MGRLRHPAACHVRADTDNVTCRTDADAGRIPQGRVEAAVGVAKERNKTVGRVVVAVGVAKERLIPGGSVAGASRVAKERKPTVRGVVRPGRARVKRTDVLCGAVAIPAVFTGRRRSWCGCRRWGRCRRRSR